MNPSSLQLLPKLVTSETRLLEETVQMADMHAAIDHSGQNPRNHSWLRVVGQIDRPKTSASACACASARITKDAF